MHAFIFTNTTLMTYAINTPFVILFTLPGWLFHTQKLVTHIRIRACLLYTSFLIMAIRPRCTIIIMLIQFFYFKIIAMCY